MVEPLPIISMTKDGRRPQTATNHDDVHLIGHGGAIIALSIVPLLVHELKETFIDIHSNSSYIGVPAE